jgi:hypothetical protein
MKVFYSLKSPDKAWLLTEYAGFTRAKNRFYGRALVVELRPVVVRRVALPPAPGVAGVALAGVLVGRGLL